MRIKNNWKESCMAYEEMQLDAENEVLFVMRIFFIWTLSVHGFSSTDYK